MKAIHRLLPTAHHRRPNQHRLATLNRSSSGFTIIETLFVLAIAGIILLIIFEALPTLQRNSRNNQRRQDVQTILAVVSRYELTNSGDIPPNSLTLRTILTNLHKLSYYDPTSSTAINITPTALDVSAGSMPAVTDPNTVEIYNHAKCDSNSPGHATPAGAGYSDVVALYAIETGNGTASQCQQL